MTTTHTDDAIEQPAALAAEYEAAWAANEIAGAAYLNGDLDWDSYAAAKARFDAACAALDAWEAEL